MSRHHRFTVEGARRFPLDMLRYDAAWPASGGDVTHIQDSLTTPDQGRRRVELVSAKKPTPERWESFLWTVLEVRHY